MALRLGLKTQQPTDFDELLSPLLDTMQELELDFHLFFRRLSALPVSAVSSPEDRLAHAGRFFYAEEAVTEAGKQRVADWLARWQKRVVEDWGSESSAGGGGGAVSDAADAERMAAMKRVNPNFVPRGWILDELIRRVEKEGEREVLKRAMHMALHPFEDSWAGREFDGVVYEGDKDEEARWTSDPPRTKRAMQCSCSS
jgi:uncharacterized protein YdiU (UPF0061 family)